MIKRMESGVSMKHLLGSVTKFLLVTDWFNYEVRLIERSELCATTSLDACPYY